MNRGLAMVLAATGMAACGTSEAAEVRMDPVVVQSPLLLPGAIVQGASTRWFVASYAPPRYGDPVPVEMTAYCLTRTTTRRGRYVRAGIVATDPQLFPLARYIELYDGRRYIGRFLIDDTGRLIKGNKIDIWMPTCREARLFGRRKGIAVLVPREPNVQLAGSPKSK